MSADAPWADLHLAAVEAGVWPPITSIFDRIKLFRALRKRTDPLNRLHNSYFAYLLG